MDKKKLLLRRILVALVAAFILITAVAEIYRVASHSVKTMIATQQTVPETLDTEMYVIRDETMLEHTADGVVLPLAHNADRVSRGSTIAAVFADEETADHFAKLRSLTERLEVYQKIDRQLRLADVDLESLTAETDKTFLAIINGAYENDFSQLDSNMLDLSEKLSRYQISLEKEVDCSAQISALEAQVNSLSGNSEPRQIVAADISGYFVARPDGYEGVLTCADADSLTADRLREAFKTDPQPAPENNIGKIIDGYRWFVACILDASEAARFKENAAVKLMLDDTEENTVTASVYSVQVQEDGTAVVLFKCTLMNARLCALRKVSGRIVMKEYSGLKVSKDALRFDHDGNLGVYVLRGDVVSFRSVREIYAADSFIIASPPADPSELPYKHLQLYDEVITSGKDLNDGMVIR